VLLDMIGDADLRIFYEEQSYEWDDTRPLVEEIWGVAKRLGVREFVPRLGPTVNDDHVPLCRKAKIPTCDVIDFDYPYWHTRGDTPDKCSALSLAKVGWVISEWLKKSGQ
jgi:glutaminyl-peptide cyclotransferase